MGSTIATCKHTASETKTTNSKVEDKLDHLASMNNKELVKNHRTIYSRIENYSLYTGAEVSDATVHSMQRSQEELETEVKTKGNDKSQDVQ